jgi:REP element-mobilizing transposase RayT
VEYEHAFYHVISRGHRRENIFRCHSDRNDFLKKLSQTTERLHLKIHAYVLMSNHYHLLIETPKANLAKAMHDLNAGYANWYRSKYRLVGSIFQGRYRAIVVEKDEYLLVLSAYIHLNPVKAGMARKPEDYVWSSYRSYIGQCKPPCFLSMEDILAKFRRGRAYGRYVAGLLEVEKGIAHKDVYGKNSFLGSDTFIRRTLSNYRKKSRRDGEVSGESDLRRIDADVVLAIMMADLHIKEDEIQSRRKGNIYRKIFIYLLRQHTGLSWQGIGELLGMKYRTTAELHRYFAKELSENEATGKRVARIEKKIRQLALLD